MSDETPFVGHRARVEVRLNDNTPAVYEVLVDNRIMIFSAPELPWANALAAAVDAYMPEGWSTNDALRVAYRAFAVMPGAKYLVADILSSEADRLRAQSLNEMQERQRERYLFASQRLDSVADEFRGRSKL